MWPGKLCRCCKAKDRESPTLRSRQADDISVNRLRIALEREAALFGGEILRHVMADCLARDDLAALGCSDKPCAEIHGVAERGELVVAAFNADRADECL